MQVNRTQTPRILIIGCSFLISCSCFGQDTIYLDNPSFEGVPRAGGVSFSGSIQGWYDCGLTAFPGETPPDLHPHPDGWRVNTLPHDGSTYVGMVVRANDTHESLSQALSSPLQPGQCYEVSLYLAMSPDYFGARTPDVSGGSKFSRPFVTPASLRIWGGKRLCGQHQLLAQSPQVTNHTWREFTFIFRPKEEEVRCIRIEAFYKPGTFIPYDGHVLVDGMSTIVRVECE